MGEINGRDRFIATDQELRFPWLLVRCEETWQRKTEPFSPLYFIKEMKNLNFRLRNELFKKELIEIGEFFDDKLK